MKRSTGTPVNLLPLLDVLLCTMGTLIVVLGVLNRLARNHSVDQHREEDGDRQGTDDAAHRAIDDSRVKKRSPISTRRAGG